MHLNCYAWVKLIYPLVHISIQGSTSSNVPSPVAAAPEHFPPSECIFKIPYHGLFVFHKNYAGKRMVSNFLVEPVAEVCSDFNLLKGLLWRLQAYERSIRESGKEHSF